MNSINDRLLVTGANGQLGRAVVEELRRLGATHIVAATRNPEKLNLLGAHGVEVRAADFDHPETLRSTFSGVDRMVIISTDALDVPGKRLTQHRAAIAAAVQSGVKHVVYTSAPSPHPTAEGSLINDHFWTEAALFAAPFTWTILRNQLYMELILMSAEPAAKIGKLFSATKGRGRGYVSRDDCARAIAGALIQAQSSEVLDVTGPAAVTQDELAAMLGQIIDRPVEHIDVSPQNLAKGLERAGLPAHMVKVVVDFDVQTSQGYHSLVTPTVERLAGTRPVTLDDFLRKHLK
jgi:NAD(P)H dehydrogenase (quinone)